MHLSAENTKKSEGFMIPFFGCFFSSKIYAKKQVLWGKSFSFTPLKKNNISVDFRFVLKKESAHPLIKFLQD